MTKQTFQVNGHIIEELLGMPSKTIGTPPWVSGDQQHCSNCKRKTNWLDIVSSSLDQVHSREMITRVILGEQKFVNTEALKAKTALLEILEVMETQS